MQLFVSDLDILIVATSDTKKIQSNEYKAAYALYTQGLYDLKLKQEKATRDFERNNILYKKGVISKVEFEEYQHQRNIFNNTIKQWKRRHANQWEVELSDYEQKLVELESAQKQLSNNEGKNVLTAPVSGTLLEAKGLQTNSVVQAGQQIAELSPKGKLVVECYIAPSDIGYLQHKTPVKFSVDAFNYNQWGVANGSVINITDDIELMDGKPVFKLRCSMNTRALKLKNGVEGRLKKGMTLTAQFVLTQRSLFDLLYDKVDDWLNPAQRT
jgi:HlyD family secretion protein